MVQRDGHQGRQVIGSSLLYCILLLLLWAKEVSALADFSGYLTKLLENRTVSACDGDHLSLQCPRHSTVSIQSAFYGNPLNINHRNCSALPAVTMHQAKTGCWVQTALQNTNIATVYLPSAEYKSTSVCENNELKLHCKEPKLLNIYSAVYGRSAHEKNTCPDQMDRGTPYDCLSYAALDLLAQRCYGKQRCKMTVNDENFGSPCLPGVVKYLTINYSCVPKILLTEVDPKLSVIAPSLKQNDGGYDNKLVPRESQTPSKDGLFLSNLLAAFSYIRDHPETTALFFTLGVSMGLIITVFALVIQISRRTDGVSTQKINGHAVCAKDCEETAASSSEEEEEEEDDRSAKSHFSEEFRQLCKASRLVYNAVDAADLAERIERREQIIQEIWLNSGLDLPPNSLTNPYF
ncbi:hypothetical protein XELAEV_18011502mg [Xenopus laevis]|uniref:SUEL-type lectin domain-containing protein n=1 Tax=Xenopus laevis TaxID=8355 RepID=A0A974DN97_XENLA|nr:hypothetical protein XELAEV_18011502mg [Xenopus laevis]